MRTRITAQDIIDKVDEQYKNVRSDAYKINKINEAIDKLYNRAGDEDVIAFQTTADVALYTLDDTISFDQINAVTVSFDVENPETETHSIHKRYLPIELDDDLFDYCYFKASEGVMGIYPVPTENGQIVRVSYQSAGAYVASVSDSVPLDTDHKMVAVYYVMMKIAEAADDIFKFNNFTKAYNDELAEIKEREWQRNGKYPSCQDVMRKPTSKSRRYMSRHGHAYYTDSGWRY